MKGCWPKDLMSAPRTSLVTRSERPGWCVDGEKGKGGSVLTKWRKVKMAVLCSILYLTGNQCSSKEKIEGDVSDHVVFLC